MKDEWAAQQPPELIWIPGGAAKRFGPDGVLTQRGSCSSRAAASAVVQDASSPDSTSQLMSRKDAGCGCCELANFNSYSLA